MDAPTPLRSDAEVIGAYIPMTLGGQAYRLPVLPMSANRKWTREFAREVRNKLLAVGPLTTADEVALEVAKSAQTQLELLISYDKAGAEARGAPPVLPDYEWLDTHATDTECYNAMKLVTVAAFPPAPDLMAIIPEFMPMIMQSLSRGVAAAAVALTSARSTSSSAPRTESALQPKSRTNSQMSSSSSMPRKPKRGSVASPKPS